MNKASTPVTAGGRKERTAALPGTRQAVPVGTVLLRLTTGAAPPCSVFAPPVPATQLWSSPPAMPARAPTSR
ncbi:hypothetical protein, partial [Actinobaculum suis]|uniref:hypothetical protein n=1 Tax=Actinobaculum suis TaxID=1657 RepID=UPI001C3FFF11